MADKTTDILVSKDLAINIRYFSEKQRKVPDCLLEIVSMSSATGDFNTIKKTLVLFRFEKMHRIWMLWCQCNGRAAFLGLV